MDEGFVILGSWPGRVDNIERKVNLLSSGYENPARELFEELQSVSNMVLREHGKASEQEKREMSDDLKSRLRKLSRAMEDCEQLVDVLYRRNRFMAGLMRALDLRRIRKLQAEVKRRTAELDRGITRLKTRWAEDELPTRTRDQKLNDQQEQWASTTSSNVPSTAISELSQAGSTTAVTPTTTLANASIGGGQFNTVGGNMFRNTVYDYSQHTSIHNHFHY
ncbi:hypothetical protein GYMLUDRAFT_259576 [Collybiopsis luxurians FD-317 M1]|uniref:Uncharacterized protein n=1 Tax=Collybiopsis luxurians FD-317 M1 TaxID=944289 RepID=A0A0D0D257_9AGAR|nr:hypothetical protein GYMLUDRAFT_259576 [Collybiopsis luxurians FD-317 M1]